MRKRGRRDRWTRPLFAITDPTASEATSTDVVNTKAGALVTLTGPAPSQVLADPSNPDPGRWFTFLNNDTSTDSITVDGITVEPGEGINFVWDGTEWLPTGDGSDGSPSGDSEQVLANCLSGDAVGDAVYITGAISLGRYQVSKVDPADYSKMPAVGMIIAKSTATECTVQFRGRIESIYTGLTPGNVLFVGTSGALVSTPPTPGPSNMFIQKVGVALSTTVVGFEPDLTLTRRRA